MTKSIFQSILSSVKSFGIQPVLTIILIIALGVLIFQTTQNQNNNNTQKTVQLESKVTFEDAVKRFKSGQYEVLTFGTLLVINPIDGITNTPGTPTKTPTPTVTPTKVDGVEIYSNPYDYMLFTLDKTKVKRIDVKTYGQNVSVFEKTDGKLVYTDNSKFLYTEYPVPQDTEKDALAFFQGARNIMQTYFLLIPIIEDFEKGIFNPVERSTNVYSGLWKHPTITSGKAVDIVIQTDGSTGLFRRLIIPSLVSDPNYTSTISFEFRTRDESYIKNYENLGPNYNKVDLEIKYKFKS